MITDLDASIAQARDRMHRKVDDACEEALEAIEALAERARRSLGQKSRRINERKERRNESH